MFYNLFAADFGVPMIVHVETFLFDLVVGFLLIIFDFFVRIFSYLNCLMIQFCFIFLF